MARHWWYGLAATLFCVSAAGYTVSVLVLIPEGTASLDRKLQEMVRADIPGVSELELVEMGSYTIFYEPADGASAPAEDPGLQIELRGLSGTRVPIEKDWGRVAYDFGYDLNSGGTTLGYIEIAQPGKYEVSVAYAEPNVRAPAVLAFGQGVESQLYNFFGGFGWWLLSQIGIAAAVAMAVVTYFRGRAA